MRKARLPHPELAQGCGSCCLAILQSISLPYSLRPRAIHQPCFRSEKGKTPSEEGWLSRSLHLWGPGRATGCLSLLLAVSVRSQIKPVQRPSEPNRDPGASIGMPEPSPVCLWGLPEASFSFRVLTPADSHDLSTRKK